MGQGVEGLWGPLDGAGDRRMGLMRNQWGAGMGRRR